MQARAPRGCGLLWQRNFRLLWLGETVSGAGTAMAAAGVPLLAVTVLHASTFAVAALTAAAYLPWLVIGLPAGAWVDRLPVRPLMITCDVISALLYASLPAAAWAGVLTVAGSLAAALLAGSAGVLFATAYQVLLPSLVSAGELVEGNAKLQGSASVAAIGGRGAAGLAAEAVGAAALLFNAASFLVSAACLLRIRAGAAPPSARTSRARPARCGPTWRRACGFIARDPYLRPAHPVRGRGQPGLHRQHGAARGLPGPGRRIRPGRRRPAPGHGRRRRGARRRARPAAGPLAGDRPCPAAGHRRCRAVQPAHPAVLAGTRAVLYVAGSAVASAG